MQEGLARLRDTKNREIWLYADNQNALRALSGDPTTAREYVGGFLEDVKILQQGDCEVKGKWTPSHQDIQGNKQADTLAKNGLTLSLCSKARTTLSWLRSRPYHNMIKRWHACHPGHYKPKNKTFPSTSSLPRRPATVISRRRANHTAIDSSPLRQRKNAPAAPARSALHTYSSTTAKPKQCTQRPSSTPNTEDLGHGNRSQMTT